MRSLIHELLQEEQPAAGVSFGGPVMLHRSCAIVASHPWLGEHSISSLLEAEFGVPSVGQRC